MPIHSEKGFMHATRRRLVVYVLCFDDASESLARDRFGNEPWTSVLRLPPSPYFESQLYTDGLLMDRRHEWENADYVGCLSYRADEKIKVTHVPSLVDACHQAFGPTARIDMCALFQFSPVMDGKPLSFLEQASHWHRRFPEVWSILHAHVGQIVPTAEAAELRSVSMAPTLPLFACNYWVASPAWMKRYCRFMRGIRHLLGGIPSIQDALWSDAEYPGSLSAEQLVQICGKPYYTYHSFLCERVACSFFAAYRARMVLVKNNKRDNDLPLVFELRSGADVIARSDPAHGGPGWQPGASHLPANFAGRAAAPITVAAAEPHPLPVP